VTYPTNILQLTDDEQHELAKVAVLRLQVLDLPGVALALKRECRFNVNRHIELISR